MFRAKLFRNERLVGLPLLQFVFGRILGNQQSGTLSLFVGVTLLFFRAAILPPIFTWHACNTRSV